MGCGFLFKNKWSNLPSSLHAQSLPMFTSKSEFLGRDSGLLEWEREAPGQCLEWKRGQNRIVCVRKEDKWEKQPCLLRQEGAAGSAREVGGLFQMYKVTWDLFEDRDSSYLILCYFYYCSVIPCILQKTTTFFQGTKGGVVGENNRKLPAFYIHPPLGRASGAVHIGGWGGPQTEWR